RGHKLRPDGSYDRLAEKSRLHVVGDLAHDDRLHELLAADLDQVIQELDPPDELVRIRPVASAARHLEEPDRRPQPERPAISRQRHDVVLDAHAVLGGPGVEAALRNKEASHDPHYRWTAALAQTGFESLYRADWRS